ncbi:cytochrome P450 [Akkermansiaceae bacterium]|nr:cytochrome P450 [Akkermansiaceae bacterium]
MPTDPFKEARQKDAILKCPFQGEEVPMLLRHADVRAAAKDWETYSSDAPFRVPIPSEEEMRTMRQLPIETNPPEHKEYRSIVDPFFQRSKKPEVTAKVESLIAELLAKALACDSLDAVRDFALPIQSRALTYLLDVPENEADIYISWGMHVFSGEGGSLEDYLSEALDKAEANPGDDFFSALTKASYQGRPLTREEMLGFANLTFAGGRDTIIHSISSIIAHFAKHPADLEALRENPKGIVLAGEEFFRAFMPLTHIGRICPVTTDVYGHEVPPEGRVSLGWAAANFDEEVFNDPEEVDIARKPNPHVSFGFGTHLCLGAPHARLITRTLLKNLVEKVTSIEIISEKKHLETNPSYQRLNGFELLEIAIQPR